MTSKYKTIYFLIFVYKNQTITTRSFFFYNHYFNNFDLENILNIALINSALNEIVSFL